MSHTTETIINTTFVVHTSIEKNFMEWLRTIYIPSAETTGAFSNKHVARVLTRIEPDTESIAVQFRTTDATAALRWHEETAATLREQLMKLHPNLILHFSTMMETIEL